MLLVVLTAAHPVKLSEELIVYPGKSGVEASAKGMTVGMFVNLSKRELSGWLGKKLSFKEKIAIGLIQNRVKSEVRKGKFSFDSNLNFSQLMNDELPRFNIGGFLLGLVLGIIGVILAHIFSNDRVFRRNSWYGFGVWLIILVLFGAL